MTRMAHRHGQSGAAYALEAILRRVQRDLRQVGAPQLQIRDAAVREAYEDEYGEPITETLLHQAEQMGEYFARGLRRGVTRRPRHDRPEEDDN